MKEYENMNQKRRTNLTGSQIERLRLEIRNIWRKIFRKSIKDRRFFGHFGFFCLLTTTTLIRVYHDLS